MTSSVVDVDEETTEVKVRSTRGIARLDARSRARERAMNHRCVCRMSE
jgi:hypothetical protein|tara:strand:- start:3439 stop:3582 length:144 start_codon:yes stop_codon:yes gene_type:complete